MKSGRQQPRQECVRWTTLTVAAIVILVVDALPAAEVSRQSSEKQLKDVVHEQITYDGDQVWRIHKPQANNNYVNELVQRYDEDGSYSIWSNNASAADILIRSYMLEHVESVFRNAGLNYDVLINDVQQAIKEENPPLSPDAQEELEGRKGHKMEWTSYHRLKDIHDFLDYLEETYPDICSVTTIGYSIEGRLLKVLRISNGKPDVPAIWIDGGIHAREWISPASVTYIINYLVENSENLKADYYILPVANPDGYEYTFNSDRLWRKNRRTAGYSGCSGVDLNRNFGYRWGGKGTSKDVCRETYSGAAPFSEPETDAIRNFFEASSANFKAYLSFHSYGQYVLYPWGYDRRVPPDYIDLDTLGRQAAASMKQAGGAGSVYTVGNSATTLYAASGGSDDWAKAILKIKYTYTIELRDTGRYGFILPARYIIPTAKEALAAVEVVTQACKTA
ncbi:carboxypeptidase B [Harpegnathos saltator]|uniref:Carboxypeptidase B n=1 Tax=Harpegnathos saltator TaxID=610380 RepID=E2C9W7_HARSA|nr:carboxypeptidase B [Harpegnathos saltator]EFN75265.1 Carboxypeptidase B [Harpegnathos saltator]